jgi:Occluded RNA-recognition motif
MAVIGLPDTVNEIRLRDLIPHHLSLEKIEMKPQNEGAILIFEKEAVFIDFRLSLVDYYRMLGRPQWHWRVQKYRVVLYVSCQFVISNNIVREEWIPTLLP